MRRKIRCNKLHSIIYSLYRNYLGTCNYVLEPMETTAHGYVIFFFWGGAGFKLVNNLKETKEAKYNIK